MSTDESSDGRIFCGAQMITESGDLVTCSRHAHHDDSDHQSLLKMWPTIKHLPLHPDDIRARAGRSGEAVGPLIDGRHRWVQYRPGSSDKIDRNLIYISGYKACFDDAVLAIEKLRPVVSCVDSAASQSNTEGSK